MGRYGKDGVNTWDYSAKRATESVYESMERLNVDYIDLINVHDIEFQASMEGGLQKIVDETLPALVALKEKGYPIEKLAVQFSTSMNPRIATTLFSSANPDNVLKNIQYVNEPLDEQLVAEVQTIIGDQMFVRWKNS